MSIRLVIDNPDAEEQARAVQAAVTIAQLDALYAYWHSHGVAVSAAADTWAWLTRRALEVAWAGK